MTSKKCSFCQNDVPEHGQCNKCGFIDGLQRQPTEEEFKRARRVNKENNYPQFINIDMMLLDE